MLKDYGVEWDRVLVTTLGVANLRLYELRLQTTAELYEKNLPTLDFIRSSLQLADVEK